MKFRSAPRPPISETEQVLPRFGLLSELCTSLIRYRVFLLLSCSDLTFGEENVFKAESGLHALFCSFCSFLLCWKELWVNDDKTVF